MAFLDNFVYLINARNMTRVKLKNTLLEVEEVLTRVWYRTLRCVFKVATLSRINVDYCNVVLQRNEFMFK